MDEVSHNNFLPATTVYKPSEIIGIFNSILAKQSVNAQVVYLRGVYLASGRQSYSGYFYDTLRDEDRQEEITMYVTQQQRENLKNGNLVNVGGVLGRNVNNRGQIQIILNVSRIEVVQEQAIDENEIKRMELRQKKSSEGFKNVDSILEQLLFVDQRPRVALLFATSSITMSDFEAGINAAKSAIDFVEYRANFSNANELVGTLQSLDKGGFHVIALVRGGGARIESLDDISVLERIVSMNTPIIGAIGHVEEKIFIKQLVDKCAPTPNGLGQYFSEMVESVSEKKTKSRAALTEQIKKQFKDQLEASQKQNKELQEKLKVLTKAQEDSVKAQQEATKKHNEQVQAAQKQNKELQEQLKGIQKSHQEQITKLTEAQKLQQEQQKKQQEELNKSLGKMQESNNQLQKNLAAITTQNTESLKQLAQAKERAKDLEHKLSEAQNGKGNNLWILIAIIAIILLIVSFMLK
jgi:exonuclease VII large subunit